MLTVSGYGLLIGNKILNTCNDWYIASIALNEFCVLNVAHLNQLMKGLRGLGDSKYSNIIHTHIWCRKQSNDCCIVFLVATDSGSTLDPKIKHAGNNNPSLLNEDVEKWLKEHGCYVSKQHIHRKKVGHLAHKSVTESANTISDHIPLLFAYILIAMPLN